VQVEQALSMSRGVDFMQLCQSFQLPAQVHRPRARPRSTNMQPFALHPSLGPESRGPWCKRDA
jgi:hypothetical protein